MRHEAVRFALSSVRYYLVVLSRRIVIRVSRTGGEKIGTVTRESNFKIANVIDGRIDLVRDLEIDS